MKGIYAYWDNKLSQYVYIGKDSKIYKNKRHNVHLSPSTYDAQQINRVLQNNPERYEYRILMEGDYSNKQLIKMEKFLIKHFKTFKYDYSERHVFNFTKGGDGMDGFKHSEETKKKISEANKGKHHSPETEFKKGEHHSPETEFKKGNKPWNTGKKRPELSKEKHPNWKNYARIVKKGFNSSGKQVYAIAHNGNKRIKTSVNKESLKKWFNENYPNVKLIDETKEEKQQ